MVKYLQKILLNFDIFADVFTTETAVEDTSNDAVLAQMLQANFDMEYNSYLKKQENHINKNCKVRYIFFIF